MRKRRLFLTSISLSLLLCLLAGLLMPWHSIAERRLVTLLEQKGLKNVQLQVSGIGFHSLALRNISVGEKKPLTLDNLTIDYSPAELWNGRIKTLTLSHLLLELGQTGGSWNITGLEQLGSARAAQNDSPIPVNADAIPLNAASLEKSQLHIASNSLSGDIPLQLTWNKSPIPSVDYTGTALSLKTGGMAITTGDASLHAELKDKAWQGKWGIKNIALTGMPFDMPSTDSSGTVTVKQNGVVLAGEWGNGKAGIKARFTLNYSFTEPAQSGFTLNSFTLPWNGGAILISNVTIPLSGKQGYTIPIQIKSVSVDALLQPLTGKRATATGKVSGTIPITIKRDGSYGFESGSLAAEQPGTIIMQPDAIPGDNAQLNLLRDVMKDFHYKILQLGVDNSKNNKLSVTLSLEGNNPAVYNGRPVKLNVHLGGDVLDFIRSSMSLNDPRDLVKQGTHAP